MTLIRQKQVEEKYGLSRNTLHEYMREGVLTEHRTAGNQRRYDETEIAKMLEAKSNKEIKQQVSKSDVDLDSRMLQIVQNSGYFTRSFVASRLGKQFNGDRDLYSSFGYVITPQYADYRALYDRTGLATRIVEILPDDTWRKPAVLIDGNERSDGAKITSPFLKAWNELADRLNVWSMFRQVDILCGIGRYAVLFMGAPGDLKSPAGNNNVAYLSAFDESQANIQDWVMDPSNPRYGLPQKYSISFNMYEQGMPSAAGSEFVDASRVIHVTENRLGSRVYGRPRLQSVINDLFDLEKVRGGSAEAVWLTVFKGFVLSSKEGAEMPAPGTPEAEDLKTQMTNFVNRIQRFITLDNADVKDLGVERISTKETYDVLIDDLMGSIGVPKRIFFGSEAGQLASTQDLQAYSGKIVSRQTNYAAPEILKPFVMWCIAHKVMPPPQSGSVALWWPQLYEMTLSEKAVVMKDVGDGAFRGSNGMPETIITPDELRKIIDLPPMVIAAEQQLPGAQITPTPTGTVGNRPGKDETGATVEAGPK